MMSRRSKLVVLLTSWLAVACDDAAKEPHDVVTRDAALSDASLDASVDASIPMEEASLPLMEPDAHTNRQDDAASDAADGASVGPDPASGDPGKPASPYGPKAEARLYVDGQEVGYVFFTALAPERADLAHLFAAPEPNASIGVGNYYISLVVDHGPWRVDSYSAAIGGRLRFELSDGRSYASNAATLPFSLTTTNADVVMGDFYLRGTLEVTVPSTQAGAPPVVVKMKINTL